MAKLRFSIDDVARRVRRRSPPEPRESPRRRRNGAARVGLRDAELSRHARPRRRRVRARRRSRRRLERRDRRHHHGAKHVRAGAGALGRHAGAAGGATTRPSTRRCSFSPITRASRSRWTAGRPSTSSPKASRARWSVPSRRPAAGMSASAAAPTPRSSICGRGLIDEIEIHVVPSCSAGARGCSRTSTAAPPATSASA